MADEHKDKGRLRSYVSNRTMGGLLGSSVDFMNDAGRGVKMARDFTGLRYWWNGPETDEEGKRVFAERVAPLFSTKTAMDSTRRNMMFMAGVMFVAAVLFVILLVIYDLFVFRIGALVFSIVLAGYGVAFLHRAEQFRQRRIFGLREMFLR